MGVDLKRNLASWRHFFSYTDRWFNTSFFYWKNTYVFFHGNHIKCLIIFSLHFLSTILRIFFNEKKLIGHVFNVNLFGGIYSMCKYFINVCTNFTIFNSSDLILKWTLEPHKVYTHKQTFLFCSIISLTLLFPLPLSPFFPISVSPLILSSLFSSLSFLDFIEIHWRFKFQKIKTQSKIRWSNADRDIFRFFAKSCCINAQSIPCFDGSVKRSDVQFP